MRLAWCVLVVVFVTTAGCDSHEHVEVPEPYAGMTNPFDGDPAAAALGMAHFNQRCADCHGHRGRGDGPQAPHLNPAPADLQHHEEGHGDDYLFWRVAEGGSVEPFDSSMPGFKAQLTEDEIWYVVTHVRTLHDD